MESRDKPSPLRNSKAVNRPFQSPLRSSPYSKNLATPERRINRQPLLLAKKICQVIEQPETDKIIDKEVSVDEADLKRIRDRLSSKKQELEKMKQQLYQKKHQSQELNNLIKRWLHGCQEALTQFQKDIRRNGGTAMEMTEILTQLGIPPNLVQYSVEDCDFV